ncbi:hypothetical protein NP493_49g10023 [Ridgeia piscesae]|uniref:Secreted protein n=1 Tax=Ridgeia piscesae TaxID=27915 RepID=A0AAD9PB80_RIDPI|nr:hypothetical protein NP493_49g10023 [Ridgeia piscesae]
MAPPSAATRTLLFMLCTGLVIINMSHRLDCTGRHICPSSDSAKYWEKLAHYVALTQAVCLVYDKSRFTTSKTRNYNWFSVILPLCVCNTDIATSYSDCSGICTNPRDSK